jgi:hypothetical protein
MSDRQLTREELYERVWTTGSISLAKEFGLTYPQFVRLCKRLNIPRPAQAYWAQVRLGRPAEKTPLPPAAPGMSETVTFARSAQTSSAVAVKTGSKSRAKALAANEMRSVHPLVRSSWEHFKGVQFTDTRGRLQPPHQGECLRIVVTRSQVRRALLLFELVIRECRRRNWPVRVVERTYYRKYPDTLVLVDGQELQLTLIERVVRTAGNAAVQDLLERTSARGAGWSGTSLFCLGIGPQTFESPFAVEEKPDKPLEGRLDEIMTNIQRCADRAKVQEQEWREQRRGFEEQARIQLEQQRERERESQRRLELEKHAERWQLSERFRAFIAAAESQLSQAAAADVATAQWLNWARAHADQIDPLRNGVVAKSIAELARPATPEQPPPSADAT